MDPSERASTELFLQRNAASRSVDLQQRCEEALALLKEEEEVQTRVQDRVQGLEQADLDWTSMEHFVQLAVEEGALEYTPLQTRTLVEEKEVATPQFVYDQYAEPVMPSNQVYVEEQEVEVDTPSASLATPQVWGEKGYSGNLSSNIVVSPPYPVHQTLITNPTNKPPSMKPSLGATMRTWLPY